MSETTDAGDPSPPRLSTLERFIILTSAIPAGMIFTTMTPILHKIQEALATGPNDAMLVRMMFTVVGVAMMIGSPLAGWIIDRVGIRILLIAAVLLWIGLGCFSFVVHDLHILIATRFIQGLAVAAIGVVGLALLGELPDEIERGHLMGIGLMCAAITSIATLVIAGMIGDIDWRYTFLMNLIYLPVAGCGLLLRRNKIASHNTGLPPQAFWKSFPFGLALISFLAGFVAYTNSTYIPYRYREMGIEKSTMIGIAMTAQAMAAATASVLFSTFRRRTTADNAFKVSFVVAAIGATLSAFMPGYWLTTASQLVFGLGFGAILPNILAVASAATGEKRGRTTGAIKGLYYGAALATAVLLEPIMRFRGPSAVMLTMAAMAMIAAAGIAIFREKRS